MRKILQKSVPLLLAGTVGLWAGLVDAVSIVVDDQPITLYEIYKAEQQLGLSKQKAVEYLIKQKLRKEELKRLGISVDEFDLNNEIEKIAQKNGIDSLKMRSVLAQRGIDWETYREQVREKLLQERLYQKIVSTKIQPPSEATLKEYYRLHIKEFSIPEAIEVIEYSAPDRKSLKEAMTHPMASVPGVERRPATLRPQQLSRELFYLLTQTPERSFTQVIPAKGRYVAFYVRSLVNPKPLPYERVKNQVYAKWMEEKRAEAIKSHFEKLRAAADVRVLRSP
ncbi:MAG: peptidyl-prolyl cis-trans isomerase [Epsilonproteobacteria bacterium]|jgi:hypothetical protein|nr:peptidyl-prolyl cis-trans isomerase [Campylobacterota bacterium]